MDRSAENPTSDPLGDQCPSPEARPSRTPKPDMRMGAESDNAGPASAEDKPAQRVGKLVFRRVSPAELGRMAPHFDVVNTPLPTQPIAPVPSATTAIPAVPISPAPVSPAPVSPAPISPAQTLASTPAIRIDTAPPPPPVVVADREGENDAVNHSAAVASRPRRRGRNETLRHGVVMMATVLGMLAAARFILPGIVEEIRYAQHRGQLRAEFEVANDGLKNVSLDTISQAYQMVSAAVGPSVVHIDIQRTGGKSVAHPDIPGAPSILISDQGSGVVVDDEGHVLTNAHVVATSDAIVVTLSDGRIVDATVIGTDELTDLALLKVNARGLMPIRWGDSERARVGSPVWAIGSPFGLDRTVTFGILSGKHRVVRAKDRYQDFMQSDVAVNPGNSGGPLVDSRGTMIGINTAIVGDTYQGVSFAIPSSVAKKIYLYLRENGSVERGWLGVSLAEVPDDQLLDENHRLRGALILSLADEASGAARAGLRSGDIVTRVDSERIRDVNHLMQLIGNAMAGSQIALSVFRDGKEIEFDILLGRCPAEYAR